VILLFKQIVFETAGEIVREGRGFIVIEIVFVLIQPFAVVVPVTV
jgi:hypothetical protein